MVEFPPEIFNIIKEYLLGIPFVSQWEYPDGCVELRKGYESSYCHLHYNSKFYHNGKFILEINYMYKHRHGDCIRYYTKNNSSLSSIKHVYFKGMLMETHVYDKYGTCSCEYCTDKLIEWILT